MIHQKNRNDQGTHTISMKIVEKYTSDVIFDMRCVNSSDTHLCRYAKQSPNLNFQGQRKKSQPT